MLEYEGVVPSASSEALFELTIDTFGSLLVYDIGDSRKSEGSSI